MSDFAPQKWKWPEMTLTRNDPEDVKSFCPPSERKENAGWNETCKYLQQLHICISATYAIFTILFR